MKKKFALEENAKAFIRRWGSRVGFLTLTFADDVQCAREASRRFNSLRTNYSALFKEYICVQERQKSGRVHYHILVVCPFAWPSNFPFAEVARRQYAGVPKRIRSFWRRLVTRVKAFGFGRTELMPVFSEGAGAYLAKYLTKGERHPLDKGVRLVRYSFHVDRTVFSRFSWITPRAILFSATLWLRRQIEGGSVYSLILDIRRGFDHEDYWYCLFNYFTSRNFESGANLLRGYLRRFSEFVPRQSFDLDVSTSGETAGSTS